MIEDTITKLEARLKNSDTLPAASRSELLLLLGTLKREVSDLEKTKAAHVISYSSPSGRPASDSLNHQLRDFVASVETSHPQTTQILDRISKVLADLGM
jgi:hypothetical protein